MFDNNYYKELKYGEERFKYLKKEIAEADAAHDYAQGFDLRYKYIQESVMHGDEFKGLIMFPEYMAYYDAHSDACDRHDLMWAFKWIIEDALDFYQIPLEKVEEYYEEFRRRCEEYGISLRTYYMKKMSMYAYTDIEKLKACHKQFRRLERDRLSDCHACEMNMDIRMELRYGSEKKAMEMVADMLRRGISCGEVPEVTFGECIRHFTRKGNIAEAEYYADMMMPMIKGRESNFLMEISYVLMLKALTSPNDAYDLFRRSISVFLESKNPDMRFYFANAAAKFFDSLIDGEHTKLVIKLPHSFPLYNEENEYEFEKMRDYFADIAKDIADKFDERNGSSYYNDFMNFEYPTEPTGELYLPAHSAVPVEPAAVAVLYKSGESLPALEWVVDTFKELPDTKVTGVYFNQENGVLTIVTENSAIDDEVEFSLFIREAEGIADLQPVHYIPEEKAAEIEGFEAMIVVTCKYIKREEMYCFNLLLAAAKAINTDGAPVYADLVNSKLFSSDWVDVQTKDFMPVPEKYMYKINVYRSDDNEGLLDMLTTGLAQFGSRDIAVLGIKESDIDFVGAVVAQIAKSIVCIKKMSDENEPMPFGVFMNRESHIRFSWAPVKKLYPEYTEAYFGEYAVPFLHYTDDDHGIAVADFSQEDREKLEFKESNTHTANTEKCARARFCYALDAFGQRGGEMIVGLELPMPEDFQEQFEDDKAYVFAKLEEGGTTAVIVQGYEEIEQYADGKTVSVVPEEVFFWRLDIDGDFHFADETYLLI